MRFGFGGGGHQRGVWNKIRGMDGPFARVGAEGSLVCLSVGEGS